MPKKYVPTPGTVTEFIYNLGTENPGAYADREGAGRMLKEAHAAGYPDATIQHIHSLRSQFGFGSRKAKAKAAKAKPKAKPSKPAQAPASNGHTKAPARPSTDAAAEFRRLVQRIGTDSARDHLARLERDE